MDDGTGTERLMKAGAFFCGPSGPDRLAATNPMSRFTSSVARTINACSLARRQSGRQSSSPAWMIARSSRVVLAAAKTPSPYVSVKSTAPLISST